MKCHPGKRPSHRGVDSVYAKLPRLECKGLCRECCGPVLMSRVEWGRIVARLGHAPQGDDSLVCPMLDRGSGRCRVYDIRPLICRLWGLVEAMACPHGCKPSRWLTDDEAFALIAEMERAGQ